MKDKITTLEMEIAVMRWLGIRQNLVVPNVSWGLLNYEADVVSVTPSGYATEVEIKVSKADLLADFKKGHSHDSKLFKYLYYAVPEEMQDYALERIWEKAGLLVAMRDDYGAVMIVKVRDPKLNIAHRQWTLAQRMKLAELGAMRILGLKEGILSMKNDLKYMRKPETPARSET